jgi:hypothetical protein
MHAAYVNLRIFHQRKLVNLTTIVIEIAPTFKVEFNYIYGAMYSISK